MDDDSKETKVENVLESLEFELLKELTTDEDENKLLEKNVTSCTQYMDYGYGSVESKQNIRNNYLKKLKIEIERLNGIDVAVKCKDFRTNNNKSIVTFNNINKSSITYNTKLNSTTIKWSVLDAQKQSFVLMNNPLICLVGISEFKGLTCSNIVGAKYDMIALRRLFEDSYGYKVVHQNDRMIWTREQIKDFFDMCIQQVLNCDGWEYNDPKLDRNDELNGVYDGIIVVISTHGGENEVIYDSYEKPYNLHKIYEQLGSDYPALLKIPRIFVVDACRGDISNKEAVYAEQLSTDDNKEAGAGSKSRKEDYEEKEKDVVVHKGSNRVTLFGNSPGFTTSFSYNEDSEFGCSFFIRSIIELFKEYEKNTSELYTPILSDMLSTVKYKLGLLTQEKQIPYKNGDVRLDKLKILKKKVFNNRMNDQYDPKWVSLKNKKYLHEFSKGPALVRWYKYKKPKSESEAMFDASKYSVREINRKLKPTDDGPAEIQEQFPKRCQIKDFEVIPETNGEVLYTVQPNDGDATMKVKLSSLICYIEKANIEQQEEIFRQNQYALIQQAINHRFIQLEIINNSAEYNLSLNNNSTNCYFEQCEFIRDPDETIFSNGGIQTSFIIGKKLSKDDPFYYNNLCENGIVCVLKYTIRNKHDNKLRGGTKGKNNLIIAIRTNEKVNKLKNLPKPMYNCWLVPKKECKKGDKIKSFLKRFNNNVSNYKNHSYITLINDRNYDRSYWKISFMIDVDASETTYYDNQNAVLLIFGYLRLNKIISPFDNRIFKCICSYFSVHNIYAAGFNSNGVLGIGKRTSLDVYTNLPSMSSLIRLRNNIDLFVIHYTRTYIQSANDELYVCGGNLGNLGIKTEDAVASVSMLKRMEVPASMMSSGIRGERSFFIDKMNENMLHSFGYFDKNKSVKTPTPLYNINETFGGSKLIQIECGEKHSVFLTDDGNVWTMGSNKYGACGFPKPQNKKQMLILVPTLVKSLQSVGTKKLSVGAHHTLCLDNENNVWGFGRNEYGQLASKIRYSYDPMINFKPDTNEKIIDVVCGDSHSLYLMSNKTVYLFGANQSGQIGNGTDGNIQDIPQYHSKIFVEAASLACKHTVLLSTENFLWTFGSNTYHQCSIYSDDLVINKPYKVTKKEMGLNDTDYIQYAFAGYENTWIVVQESLLKQSNTYYL